MKPSRVPCAGTVSSPGSCEWQRLGGARHPVVQCHEVLVAAPDHAALADGLDESARRMRLRGLLVLRQPFREASFGCSVVARVSLGRGLEPDAPRLGREARAEAL